MGYGDQFFMRSKIGQKPDRRETVGELLYEVAQVQIAEQGLPHKAIARWFPYVATLFLFILVVNLLGFIPLPLTGETWHGVPTWGIYAATSSLSVTLALALLTFVFTHFEGIRWNGPVRYFKSWIPEAPKPLLALIVPLEILGQFMRLISLSIRLFANMLAGQMLILPFIGLMFVPENVFLAVARGDVEMQIGQITEIAIAPGVELAGPLPSEIQNTTVMTAGISTASRAPDAAKAFVSFISSPPAIAVLKASGFQPVSK